MRGRPRVIQVLGRSGSGKTLLVERLVRRLRQRGFSVAVVKHSHHTPDLRGRDTGRFAAAGADWIVFSGPRSFVSFRGEFRPAVGRLPCDIVLVEGFSGRRFGGVRLRLSSPADVAPRLAEILALPWARAGPGRPRRTLAPSADPGSWVGPPGRRGGRG